MMVMSCIPSITMCKSGVHVNSILILSQVHSEFALMYIVLAYNKPNNFFWKQKNLNKYGEQSYYDNTVSLCEKSFNKSTLYILISIYKMCRISLVSY